MGPAKRLGGDGSARRVCEWVNGQRPMWLISGGSKELQSSHID